ncbi:alpha/beta hydrolase [Paenibacillus sp. CAU 1782]
MDLINRVSPELREGFKSLPPLHLPDGLAEARKQSPTTACNSGAVKTSERFISGGSGQQLRVKLYEPSQREGEPLPALLWIHGGGYILGTPDGEDRICEGFVEGAGCVVVSPDYRRRQASRVI